MVLMGIEKFILTQVHSYLGIHKSQTWEVGYLALESIPKLIIGLKSNNRPTPIPTHFTKTNKIVMKKHLFIFLIFFVT